MKKRKFPNDPTDDELARVWTLTVEDQREIAACRGQENRHRFALQLCSLRAFGEFIEDFSTVPVKILNVVGEQIGRPPVLLLEGFARTATRSEYGERLRLYLGFTSFNEEARGRLRSWIAERDWEGNRGTRLLELAKDTLRRWKVMRPRGDALRKLVKEGRLNAERTACARIEESLPARLRLRIDEMLRPTEEGRTSDLLDLKRYPPYPTPALILDYLGRLRRVRETDIDSVTLGHVPMNIVGYFAEMARRFGIRELRRLENERRYSMVACYLAVAQRTLADYVVEMHRVYMSGMKRRAKRVSEQEQLQIRQRAAVCTGSVARTLESLLDAKDDLYERRSHADTPDLRSAIDICKAFEKSNEDGRFEAMQRRHGQLKRYLPEFLRLPFDTSGAKADLVDALEYARETHRGERKFGDDAPCRFVPRSWMKFVMKTGAPDLRLWEIALATSVRDSLRSGDLCLPESERYVSFRDYVIPEELWEAMRNQAYSELRLPHAATTALENLQQELDEVVHGFVDHLDENPFAGISKEGTLVLRKEGVGPVPGGVGDLRRLIETRLPKVRIEDLLIDVDSWCGFSNEVSSLSLATSRVTEPYPALMAAIVAHGTNLGVVAMSNSSEQVSLDGLRHMSRWFTDTESIRAANRILVNFHHELDLSREWGDGTISSSDGQRFAVQASSLLASFYPRYFGYYDRAISVYTHVSDQYSVYATQAISCSAREAVFVLDGLLENDSIVGPREHYTDTHGFTEQLFALCYLLGFSFMPRLKDLKAQRLYKLDRSSNYGAADHLIRGAGVDTKIIAEQWDSMVRVAASLREGRVSAHLVLQRLSASPGSQLSKATTMLGRVLKTIHVIRYLSDPPLRSRIQRQLNRGESRHQLAKKLFFGNRGVFRTGDYEEIMNKVSALSLLSNAVLAWNTVHMQKLVEDLEDSGQLADRSLLAHISPLLNAHILPHGTYSFERARRR